MISLQMCTRRYGRLARFGLTHMVATNTAVWLQEVVTETLRELAARDTDLANTWNATAVGGRKGTRWESLYYGGIYAI